MGITAGVGALIGGVVGGGASVASGILGSNAASDAASTQAQAANNAANLQRQTATDALNFNKQQYGNSLNIMAPWINTGQSANSRLAFLMGLNPNQGLPPGVTNPNMQGTPTGQGGTDLSSLLGGFNPGQVARTPAGNSIQAFAQGGQVPMLNASPTNQAINGGPTPVGSLPNGGLGINPGGGALNPNDPGQNFLGGFTAPGGQVPTNTVNAGGTGQIPINGAGPGGSITASINQGGGGQVPINQVGAPLSNGFGSLAQGWNQTFTSPTDVTEQNDPGYQFRLAQGQQALQNSAAARGGLLSGRTAKAINDYAQNSASNEYSNVYNRALQNYNTNYNTFSNDQSNLFNRLSALSGTGQVGANQLSNAGLSTANTNANIGLTSAGQIGQQLNNAGAASASGYVGGSNAITGALSGVANSATGALSLYQLLNRQNSNPGGQGV